MQNEPPSSSRSYLRTKNKADYANQNQRHFFEKSTEMKNVHAKYEINIY